MNSRFLFRASAAGAIVLAASLTAGCGGKASEVHQPDVPVSVASVLQRDEPLQLQAIGTVQPLRTVDVKSLVGGELTRVYFQEGEDVKAGQRLFEIDPRPYRAALAQAEANLQRDVAQAKNAAAEVERYRDLVAKDYVTAEAFDRTVAASEAAHAVVAADKAAVENAKLQLGYCDIRSPLDGRTGTLNVHAGNMVKANDVPLVTINQIEPVYATFAVPEQFLSQIRTNDGQTVEARSPQNGQSLGTGRLTFVDNAVNESTGTITLKAKFVNAQRRLWPGEFVNLVLTLGTDPNVVVVPSRAVQTGQSGQFVYVVKKDRSVENRPVTVARTVNEESIIGSGLAAGEEVVTDGQLRLTPKSRVAIKPAVKGEEAGS
ncbi:MAG: efflux RND transporter periplasmic adaptor subunit [Thermoanaerobaculia bacterium]